ncbi:MAG: hypothetical protein KBS85_07400 [Lachnospiraceae bacterium]|nr:hypothetical protein [Candidatus Merdinaster equi]
MFSVYAENVPGDASAADIYKICCISSFEEKAFEAAFIMDSDMLMIAKTDAEKIIGEKLSVNNGYIKCKDGCIDEDIRGTREKNGEIYIDFVSLTDRANIKVLMVGGVLDTERLPSYSEINDGINETFSNRKYDPFNEALEDGWTKFCMKLTNLTDVIYNLKIVDVVTTRASRDKYDSALVDVLVPGDAFNPASLLDEGNSLAKKLKKLADFDKTGWSSQDWIDAYSEMPEYMKYSDALKKYSDLSKKLHIEEACAVVEFCFTYGYHDTNIVNGLKILRKNEMPGDAFMKISSDKYINFYSDNGMDVAVGMTEKILEEFVEKPIIDEISKKGLKALGIDSTILSVERMVINGIFDTQTKIDTVKKLEVYHELQGYAKNYWEAKKKKTDNKSLEDKRDVALLYLQSQLCSISAMKKADPDLAGAFYNCESAIKAQVERLGTFTDEAIEFDGNYKAGSDAFQKALEDYIANNSEILGELTIDNHFKEGKMLLTWDYDMLGESPIMEMSVSGKYDGEDVYMRLMHVPDASNQIRIIYCTPFWRSGTIYDSGIFTKDTERLFFVQDFSKNGAGKLEMTFSNGFIPENITIDVMDALIDWNETVNNNCNFYISGDDSEGNHLDIPPTAELFEKYPTGVWEYSADLKFE